MIKPFSHFRTLSRKYPELETYHVNTAFLFFPITLCRYLVNTSFAKCALAIILFLKMIHIFDQVFRSKDLKSC